jgi:hypothetical protein
MNSKDWFQTSYNQDSKGTVLQDKLCLGWADAVNERPCEIKKQKTAVKYDRLLFKPCRDKVALISAAILLP